MQKSFAHKCLSTLLASALLVGMVHPGLVYAQAKADPENILAGKVPTSNVKITNPNAATDGSRANAEQDSNNTMIVAGTEDDSQLNNGWDTWQDVYLQYDFGEERMVQQVDIYRNTYPGAVSTFKNVKVELSNDENFTKPTVLFNTQDVRETNEARTEQDVDAATAECLTLGAKGEVQSITSDTPISARYIRVYQRGHYVTNTPDTWNGMSNSARFNEIEVYAEAKAKPEVSPDLNPEPELSPKPDTKPDGGDKNDQEMVDANVLLGKQPTTNSDTTVSGGGDSTASGILIENATYATDGEIGNSDANDGSNGNTKIVAGEEDEKQPNKGWDNWKDVYLQYDLGQMREVKKVQIYRNTYADALSIFKNVKVELSDNADFKDSVIIFGGAAGEDIEETDSTKGQPQVITLDVPVKAQYIRVWQRGQYIRNVPFGGWEGMSNGVLFNEIEVIASVPKSEIPTPPPESAMQNIALNKLPYVWGLTPTNIEAITDGKTDTNYAVHNSLGNRWLQFEYKNKYNIKKINFKLEEGLYESVQVSVSSNPANVGEVVWSKKNWTQGADMVSIDLDRGKFGKCVRFTVNKADNQPAKYSEIEIWATGSSFDESKPEYVAPKSKYDTLVWSDEFDGNTLDTNKWQIIDGMSNYGAIYNKHAVSVKDGCLALNSKNYGTTEELIKAVGWDQYQQQKLDERVTWSSGRVESKNKFSFQFGRVAVRAKPNDSQGIWPAIWMLCQDETGHDEIDILEYLGQESWNAYTTNHFGILGKNKKSHGIPTHNYEAWCQDFHVFEVEWDPDCITFFIDGNKVHSTTWGKLDRDGMHTRPMFVILETQVGGGWVKEVDYTRQETKQDSDFLIDWVRVYQQKDQPIARFDDLVNIHSGFVDDPYMTAPVFASEGLQEIHHSDKPDTPVWQDKDNFFYGGQPRVETDRVAVSENAAGEQALIYRIAQAKDVHLTTYYQTLSDGNTKNPEGWYDGTSIRGHLKNSADLNFKIYTSADAKNWALFEKTKTVENYVDAHPGYARVTFDAYGLPQGTNYVKVVFPEYKGVQYKLRSGEEKDVLNTDVQLAKVTFLQEKNASDEQVPTYAVTVNGTQASGAGDYHPMDTVTLNAGDRAGYRFDGWTVTEGNVVLDDAKQPTVHFTMPAEDVVIEANWTAIPYTVKVADSHAKQTGSGTYTVEDTVTIRAGERKGYQFNGWTVTEGKLILDDAKSSEITFRMPAGNVTVQATWTKDEPIAPSPDVKPSPDTTQPPAPQVPNGNNTTPSNPQTPSASAGAPHTGDNSHMMVWLTVVVLAAGAFSTITYKKYRKHNK